MNKNKPDLKKYSFSQQEAILASGKDVVVLAGAGSGKTSVLVERFLHAASAEDGAPERILAITFTEKAAQEMKSRLVKLCHEKGLDSLRKRLENAPISTIDSFCAKLLRENPIEAGVDPFFQILSEGESEILMGRLLDEIFRGETENALWLSLLVEYGEEPLRKFLKKYYFMTHSRLDGGKLLADLPRDEYQKEIEEEVGRITERILQETEGDDLNATEIAMREASRELLAQLKRNTYDWITYNQIEMSLGKVTRRSKRLKEAAEALQIEGASWLECVAQKVAEPVKRELARVLGLFTRAYDAEKTKLAAYDFSDLLFKACQLLGGGEPSQKALREYYRDFFSHILVDEYQDTSPLQAQLIDYLKKDDNLFVVGDRKQSIYGFRQADPVMLKEMTRRAHPVALDENYRSRAEILRWINAFFRPPVFPEDIFQELKPKRVFKTTPSHALELVCVLRDKEEIDGLEEARVAEARLLAGRIHQIVHEKLVVEEGGAPRPIRYGDIAILLRSTTSSHLYEKELAELNIPYRVVKGKGFYDKPEVKDLIHFLKWMENPDLDISLAGILRSPLFELSDDALFWIARAAKKEDSNAPLDAALRRSNPVKELDPQEASKLEFFKSFQASLRQNKNRFKIYEILEKLVRDTSYEAKLLARPQGRAGVANVRKLIEMARAAEENNIFGLGDFVRYIESLADREAAEEEAKIEPEAGDSVVISSIHAAKGLEFACVILADLGRARGAGFEAKFISSESEGMGIKLKNPLTADFIKDVSYSRVQREAAAKEKEEETRLLYVAMTRAKELLILSGSAAFDAKTGEIKKSASWMGQILNLLNQDVRAMDFIEFEKLKIKIIRESAVSSILPSAAAVSPAAIPDIRQKLAEGGVLTAKNASSAGLGFNEAAALEIEKRFRLDPKPYTALRDVSVTDLLHEESAAQEPDRPVLGFSDEENLPRNEFGTLFHKLMELSLDRVRRGQPFGADDFEPLLRGLNEKERAEAVSGMLKFWKNPLGQRIRKAAKCYPELPFIYKTPYGLLKGQIDLVFQSAEGEWFILDYKTNRISPEEAAAAAQEYEFQLGLYALVFSELYGQMPAKGILYFMTISDVVEFEYAPEKLEIVRQRLLGAFPK